MGGKRGAVTLKLFIDEARNMDSSLRDKDHSSTFSYRERRGSRRCLCMILNAIRSEISGFPGMARMDQ